MAQQLTVPSLKVASNSADKTTKTALNDSSNPQFADELERRVNDSQRSDKIRNTNTDSQPDSAKMDKTNKAEEDKAANGKNLPLDKNEKSKSVTKTEEDKTNKIDSENADTEEDPQLVQPLVVLSVNATDKKTGTVSLDATAMANKSSISNTNSENNKSVLHSADKSDKTDITATTIRADILQAIQKQGADEEAVATTNFKSMMQNASKIPQQTNVVNAETVSALRQLEPLTELNPSRPANSMILTSLPTATTNTAAPLAVSPAMSLDIQPQLNSAAWDRVMSSRVVWMAREGVHQADLRLNPAHLGPVEVRLNMQNEQANVTFIASNAAARDALEQALPRLRESFIENGLALNNAEVSQQDQSSTGSQQDEQLQDGNNNAQVIIETDDIDKEAAPVSAEISENSVGVSVFA